jgi:hypothetical protein
VIWHGTGTCGLEIALKFGLCRLWVESGHSLIYNRARLPKAKTAARRLVLFGLDRVSLDALGCDPIWDVRTALAA